MSDTPKDLDAPRHFPGRAAARAMAEDSSIVWLRKKRFGAEARNKGGHLTVKGEAGTGFDGYYSLGQVTSGGVHVMGDNDARGAFADRGLFAQNTGFTFNGGSLVSRFDGKAQVGRAERLGYVDNAQGIPCPYFLVTQYSTWSGKAFTPLYSFYFGRPTYRIAFEGTNGMFTAMAARYEGGKMNMIISGVVILQDNQWVPFIVRDFYKEDQSLEFPPVVEDQYPWDFQVERLSPTILFSKLVYKRSQYPAEYPTGVPIPNRINNTDCPGMEIRFSYDNGLTWWDASSTQLFAEFFDTVIPLPGSTIADGKETQNTNENSLFNQAIDYCVMQVAPISNTKALVYALVPFLYQDGDFMRIDAKVKVGMMDFMARTVLEVQTLYEDVADNAWMYMASQSIEAVDGGAILARAPWEGGTTNRWQSKVQYGWTTDGADILWFYMPDTAPAWYQGGVHALGPKEAGAVRFMGGSTYALMASKDHGETWTQRAVVTQKGRAPQAANRYPAITDFVYVSAIRVNNAGANPEQGAPWICDHRKPPPIR